MTGPQNIDGGDRDTPGDFGRLEQRELLPGARGNASPVSIAERKTHWLETVSRMSESLFFCVREAKTHGVTTESASRRSMLRSDLRGALERKGKRSSGSQLALAPDLPTVCFDQTLRDRESQSHSTMIAILCLPEIVEKVFDIP